MEPVTTCPELQAHVDDAVKALEAYIEHRAEGLEVIAKFDLMLLHESLEQAVKQAVIETNVLHDPAGGAF